MHWRKKWQPTPVFLPGESQGQWGLVDCITGEVPSSDQEETGELPDVMKKITEEGNLPEYVLFCFFNFILFNFTILY